MGGACENDDAAMNWRGGFSRIAVATAVLYWLGCFVGIGIFAYGEAELTKPAYTVRMPSGEPDATINGYEDNAIAATIKREYAKPYHHGPYAAPIFAYTDEPVRHDWWKGAKAAKWPLLWCAVSYCALLLMFRGLRWIALGFMEPRRPA
jgi:hypothetical protein